jgi:hypothetical protein
MNGLILSDLSPSMHCNLPMTHQKYKIQTWFENTKKVLLINVWLLIFLHFLHQASLWQSTSLLLFLAILHGLLVWLSQNIVCPPILSRKIYTNLMKALCENSQCHVWYSTMHTWSLYICVTTWYSHHSYGVCIFFQLVSDFSWQSLVMMVKTGDGSVGVI